MATRKGTVINCFRLQGTKWIAVNFTNSGLHNVHRFLPLILRDLTAPEESVGGHCSLASFGDRISLLFTCNSRRSHIFVISPNLPSAIAWWRVASVISISACIVMKLLWFKLKTPAKASRRNSSPKSHNTEVKTATIQGPTTLICLRTYDFENRASSGELSYKWWLTMSAWHIGLPRPLSATGPAGSCKGVDHFLPAFGRIFRSASQPIARFRAGKTSH